MADDEQSAPCHEQTDPGSSKWEDVFGGIAYAFFVALLIMIIMAYGLIMGRTIPGFSSNLLTSIKLYTIAFLTCFLLVSGVYGAVILIKKHRSQGSTSQPEEKLEKRV